MKVLTKLHRAGSLKIYAVKSVLKSFFINLSNIFNNSALTLSTYPKLNLSQHVDQSALDFTKAFITNASVQRLGYSENWLHDTTAKPIKVMMLGLRGFPEVQGGIETHAEHLAPMLVSLGCDLEVLVRSSYQKPNVGKHWNGVKLTTLWAPKSKAYEAIVHTFLGVLYAAIKRPDVLHIHAIGPALMTPLARLLGLRVVVTHHGPDYNRQKWGIFARHTLMLGEWFGMRFSNCRITISSVIRDLVAQKHTVNSALIHNGVVLPDLNVSSTHLVQFGLEPNKYILMVGRLVPEKRHIDLIQAFNQANIFGYKLALVGWSDHPDSYVQTLIDASVANPNIVLTGFQKGDALRGLYAHAALFVLPSSHEGLSISLLEALSYGLPVIASNIPANLEIGLSDAHYFKLGKVDEIAGLLTQHTQQVLSSVEKLDKKKQLRAWIDSQYNWKNIAEKTIKAYQTSFIHHL